MHFCQQRNKSGFFPVAQKSMFQNSVQKAFSHPAFGSVFSEKCCWDAPRSNSQLVRDWVNVGWGKTLQPNLFNFLKCWVVQCAVGVVSEKNWTHSVYQYLLTALQVLLHLIGLAEHTSQIVMLSSGFRKAAVDQTSSRPLPWSWPFSWCKFGSEKGFGDFSPAQALSWSSPGVI